MPSLHVMHVVEAFGAGTLSALIQLCKATDDVISHTIVHSLREETPDNVTTMFPASVRLQQIAMCREICPKTDWAALWKIVAQIRQHRPDVVHAHCAKAGVLARFAAWLCRVPVVYTPHGYPFLQQDFSPRKRKIFWALEWIAGKFGDLTAACGDTEATYARRFGKTTVVRNGIELKNFPVPEALPQSSEDNRKLRVGICGRISVPRNPSFFKQLAQQTKDSLQWVWVGGGEDPYNLAEAEIQTTGWLSRQEAIDHVGKLDIYVQTSLWEGLPFSVMEAMALERPVVATNIIGNNELVVHGETGFLADTDEKFLEYVKQLAGDKELRERMGKAGRKRIAEHYDSEKTMREYVEVYAGLAKKRELASKL